MAGTGTTEETKKSLYRTVRKWGGKHLHSLDSIEFLYFYFLFLLFSLIYPAILHYLQTVSDD